MAPPVVALVLGATALAGRAAESIAEKKLAPADIVELEKLTVDERGLGRHYLYAAVPGFELLSPFSPAQTAACAQELQRQRALLSVFLPELVTPPYDAPQAIFLDDQPPAPGPGKILAGRSHLLTEGVQRQSLDAIRGVPAQAWANKNRPTGTSISWSRAVGPDREIFYTSVYGFNYVRQTGENAAAAADRGLGFIFPLAAFYEHRRPRWPVWLEDGIDGLGPRFLSEQTLQFFMLSRLSPPPAGFTPADLFSPDPRSRDPVAAETRRQAACVLVNWALVGDNSSTMLGADDSRRETFWRFANRATGEPVTEEMFNTYFGSSAWPEILAMWRRAADYQTHARVPQALGVYWPEHRPRFSPVAVRPATRAELVRIKSEYEWRIGREFANAAPDLARQCLDQAGRRLRWTYAAGEREPQFLAVLALFEADAGSAADARTYLEAAVAAKVVRPQLYLQQANFRLEDEKAKLSAPNEKLSLAQARHILEPLAVARSQRPALPDVFRQMTSV